MSEGMYAIFYILIGSGLMVSVIWGVKLFKEWIGIMVLDNTRDLTIMVNELSRTFNGLSLDFKNIEAHSDIVDDKIDNLLEHVDKLERGVAEIDRGLEAQNKFNLDISLKLEKQRGDIDQLVKNIAGMQMDIEKLKRLADTHAAFAK